MPQQNQIELNVVVNGQPTPVKANVEAPVSTLIERALQQSGNSGQPVANWELRDASGQLLDPSRKIEDFNLHSGATLFLTLKAGIGG
jgi:adenine-specific DNA glycosylase